MSIQKYYNKTTIGTSALNCLLSGGKKTHSSLCVATQSHAHVYVRMQTVQKL